MNKRRFLFATGLLSVSLVAVYGDESAENLRSGNTVRRSEPVSLGAGDYTLMMGERQELYLEDSNPGGLKNRRLVKPRVVDQLDGKAEAWPLDPPNTDIDVEVTDIALARWSKKSLFAFLKIVQGGQASFWCLTFPHAEINRASSDELRPDAVLVMHGSTRHRILAIDGSREPPSIIAIVAKVSKNGEVENGMIMVHGCPNPGPINARIGHFTVEYAVRKDHE
ncbi:MAG TPA: hypothetical protein VG826_20100 [Pirellulales bacterium]|nr:hypothetical protein [Pirellulales bacterium]